MTCLGWWTNWLNRKIWPTLKSRKCQIGVPVGFGFVVIIGAIYLIHSWSHFGDVATFLVALAAVGGYWVSYRIYRKQEEHKYRPALAIEFDGNYEDKQKVPGLTFQDVPNQPKKDLKCDFTLINTGASPLADVRMNVYQHYESSPDTPVQLFEQDIQICEGVASGDKVRYARTISLLKLRKKTDKNPGQATFDQLLEYHGYGPATGYRMYDWSLVLKYKNLQGQKYFSVYKMDAGEPDGKLAVRFYGSFKGDYLVDEPGSHEFIRCQGFLDRDNFIDWEQVKKSWMENSKQTPEQIPQGIRDLVNY